jgi:hypothetical protein
MSNRFTSISATNATLDNLTTNVVKAVSTSGIQVISDVNLNSQSITNVDKLSFTNYELVEDFTNKTIAIHVLGTRFKGALFDTTLNKPYEQVLPLSQTYVLPANSILMKNDMITNPYKVFIISPTENTVFDLPALTPTNVFQNTHVRFSNESAYLVSFTFQGAPIIQMGYETISLVWRTNNGTDYTWVYIP